MRKGEAFLCDHDDGEQGCNLQVMSIIEDCWKDAAQRPSMKQIFDRLKVIVESLKMQEAGHKSALR